MICLLKKYRGCLKDCQTEIIVKTVENTVENTSYLKVFKQISNSKIKCCRSSEDSSGSAL